MSFKSPLRVGNTLLFPQQVLSFGYFGSTLAINSTLGILQLEGEGLPHCAIDLLNGLCDSIQPVAKAALPPLQWQVNTITPIKRLPPAGATIEPFEGLVPEGWILFEQTNCWHFWPIQTLLAIAQTRTALLFVYGSVTIAVEAPLPELKAEFDRWAAGSITSRHYTERTASDYSGLLPVERFAATDIHLRQCDPQQGLRGKRIEQWLSFSSTLPMPPRNKTWSIGL